MPGQLKRGIMHYAEGDPDTAPPAPPVPPPAYQPKSFREWLGDTIGMRGRETQIRAQGGTPTPLPEMVVTPEPAPPGPPSPLGQLATADYEGALKNPNRSPFTQWLAGLNYGAELKARASRVASGPSVLEETRNFFFGDPKSTEAIEARKDISRRLSDPIIQRHMLDNPDVLAQAERDPAGLAAQTRDPDFMEALRRAQGVQAQVTADPKVAVKDQPAVVAGSLATGLDPAHVNARLNPHAFTKDEFIKTFNGMPTETFFRIFGAQLGQAPHSPQQKAINEYLAELRAPLFKLRLDIDKEKDPAKQQTMIEKYNKDHAAYMKLFGAMVRAYDPLPAVPGRE